jgi:FtsP/CotA-like multicopper oxidase with cupredoxin domain
MTTFAICALVVSVVSLGAVIHKTNTTAVVATAGTKSSGPGIPIGAPTPADYQARDPRAPAPSAQAAGAVHRITMAIVEKQIEIAPGISQLMWTYDGQVPGPILRGNVGDTFEITVVNQGSMTHSIDLHASKVAPNVMMSRTFQRAIDVQALPGGQMRFVAQRRNGPFAGLHVPGRIAARELEVQRVVLLDFYASNTIDVSGFVLPHR